VLFALGACADGEAPPRQVAEPKTVSSQGRDGSVPAGRLPEGATYDFGAMRGGEADVGGAYFIGRADALVTVATFGDFQCVFCARSERATAGARDELLEDGKIRVLYLDFPLPIHARGRPAAEFARCVGRVDGARAFWRTYRMLHRTQDRWTSGGPVEEGLRSVARDVGADWPGVASCMEADTELPTIGRLQRVGRRVGIRGTPTSFFNGVPRVGAITGPVFRRMVEAAWPDEG
jgi:protein-disulfide isomerase